ncbi:MAG: phosphatase PAP2 family protein [Phycisphaerales bacterium]
MIDYNRGLSSPVRWARTVLTAAGDVLRTLFGWAFERQRQWWAPPMLMIAAALVFVLPRDEAIRAWVRSMPLSGDFKREVETLQQFGQGAISVLIGLVILLVDPARRRRLLDWIAGALVLTVVVNVLKGLIGRPRPLHNDATHAAGPFGLYPLREPEGVRSLWNLRSGWTGGYDLASMPSRHAAFAVLAAVFLSIVYPRLRLVVIPLALLVCAARVLTDAHWASDVLVGAAIGLAASLPCVRGCWGVRGLDWLWLRFVDPRATPSLPRMVAGRHTA